MNDKQTRQKTALITGASSGIGCELSKLFAGGGYNLVLVARSEPKLRQIAEELKGKFGISVTAVAKDLSVPSSPDEIFSELQQQSIKIDALVNNAGFATYGLFAETDLKAELQMMEVNMVSLTHLTKLFLRDMLEQGEGKILNIASTAAFQPGPLMAVYYATKAYVLSFSEALANELSGSGVTVTALCPGPTESGFQKRANMEESRLVSGEIMDAETVANIGYRGLMENQTVVIPGLKNQLLALSVRFTPRDWVTKIVRNMQERVNKVSS
ncbi:SDR family NAD(P)-dependent oxidoreductase [Kamptonema formosum]|uniref:SDR family NAD(P)-dependent oxidoreductase n=1 Tax=Kamptonema formosum TaxID=331992 RepID=UPI000347F5A7|nr:SDR family oxidoreductase [Oscillatoria sp. PCC 10802]